MPTNWPVVGMLPALVLNRGRIHDFLTDSLEHGGGTFMFKGPWFSNMDIFCTSDLANVHYILSKNYPNFQKGPDFKKIFEILGDGIFSAEHESWEKQRKTIMSMTSQTGYQKFVAKTTWNKVETGLIPILNCAAEKGISVDLQELFQRFAFDCSCAIVLGYDPISLCLDLPLIPEEKAFAHAEEAVLRRHTLPESLWKLQKWLQIGSEKKLKEAAQILDRFLSDRISLRKAEIMRMGHSTRDENPDCDFLTSYMRELADSNGPTVSEETWKDTMLNLIFAGKDTISAALSWFFWLLATNPTAWGSL